MILKVEPVTNSPAVCFGFPSVEEDEGGTVAPPPPRSVASQAS